MTTAVAVPEPTTHASSGGRLVATDGQELPLRATSLSVDAKAGIARTVLEQRFANVHDVPLTVTYLFPLPHDGAVSGFSFRVGGRRVVGEVDRLEAARERFEEALAEGRSAALLEQERAGVFTQSIGNVPPGGEVVVELTVDQRLGWVDGDWEWRFPTALAPRYAGEAGDVPDAERILVDVAEGGVAVRLTLSVKVRDAMPEGKSPRSPSHAVQVSRQEGQVQVELADAGGAPLDRDVVLRWPVAAAATSLSVDAFRATGERLAERAFALLTLVPPAPDTPVASLPRDLVLLLDTSGSMEGRPLEQARDVARELVQSLSAADTLEMIAFASSPDRWTTEPVSATPRAQKRALRWLDALRASGATEMRSGIVEALRPLRPSAQRQVILVTDGLIGGEDRVIAEVTGRLPPGTRVHCVGIGEAVNRSLTSPVARAGRGIEVVVGLDESPVEATAALLARTARPLVTDLVVEGSALSGAPPARLADVFGAAPVLVPLEVRTQGGEITIRGVTPSGPFVQSVAVEQPEGGSSAVAALFAREAVESLEMGIAAGGNREELDAAIEKLGLDFQIATRLTAWVADSEVPTVDPREPFRRERMPQALPHGMSVEGIGLRQGMGSMIQAERYYDFDVSLPMVGKRSRSKSARPSMVLPSPVEPATLLLKGPYRWTHDALVIAIEVVGRGFDWSLPLEVRIVDEEGHVITCVPDAARSTARGRVPRGRTIRLVLPWSEAAHPRRAEAVLVLPAGEVRVSLKEN